MDRLFLLSKEMKALYRQENFENDLVYIRIVSLLCLFFYSLFAITDFLTAQEHLGLFLRIRFLYVNPFFVAMFFFSYHPNYNKFHQLVLVMAYMAAGYGIVMMLIVEPYNFSYYGGLFLIFAVGHFLTRIYWHYVTLASITIVMSYLVHLLVSKRNLTQSIIYIFFYLAFIAICFYGSYIFERYRREKFAQTHALMSDKVLLERENYDKLVDVEESHRITIFSLAKLAESRDHYTGDHIERVGGLCLRLAETMDPAYYNQNNVNKSHFLEAIELASTLHDIGKVAIPESILMKPGRLTDEEMTIMRTHTTIGYETLAQIRKLYKKNAFVNMGIDICKYHHERWDGTGYPEGLSGDVIPLSSRVVAIVDVYDALISERPYKKAFSHQVSLEEIKKGAGSMFDPYLAEIFIGMFEE